MNAVHANILDILQRRMTNKNEGFFSNLVLYKLSQMASNMHATVSFAGGSKIPVNAYVLNLAESGFSKGKALRFLEDDIFIDFKEKFTETVMIDRPKAVISAAAEEIALISGDRPDLIENDLWRRITELPKYVYAFGSGTTVEGLKGMMTKLSMTRTGAVSIEIDEIGSNLTGNKEVMDTLLETWDMGLAKNKLKLTQSNDEILHSVPTNLLMFGTPAKLFDGSKTEEELMSFLDIGYARRLLFGYVKDRGKRLTAAERIDQLTDITLSTTIENIKTELGMLADTSKFGIEHELTADANIVLFTYQEECEKKAEDFKSHEDIQKTEMEHRYFKALKIAGVYAFIDGSTQVTDQHVKDAIEVVEKSGEQFREMMHKDKAYVRLAKYIAEQDGSAVTLADFHTDLKFFKGTEGQKREMITLAKAWAASNNIVITEKTSNDITYFSGETIQETELNRLIVSTSIQFSDGYKPHYGEWENFKKMAKMDINFCTHHFKDEHRSDENVLKPFNLLVLDVEKSITLDMAMHLLAEYKGLYYTTKRHSETDHRFRVILPLSKTLNLSVEDHKKFYKNVFEWLPFAVDEVAHPSAKWQCYSTAKVFENEGEKLFDPTLFLPNTMRERETKDRLKKFSNNTNKLERHILTTTEGRNNALLKLALVHVDKGHDEDTVETLILATNSKLDEPLSESEIRQTIMKTVRRKIQEREENDDAE